jgi:hypothetical protein
VTSHSVRCSAWFGSVKFGFLAPGIFIRELFGSAQFFHVVIIRTVTGIAIHPHAPKGTAINRCESNGTINASLYSI